METERLKQFCVVAEMESLTKAADILGITLSGLHKSLRALESELGLKLTQPKGRGITMTEEALRIYPRIKEIIRSVDDIKDTVVLPSEPDRFLRIGAVEVFIPLITGDIAANADFSNTKLEVHELPPGQLEDAIKKDLVDFGVTYIPMPTRGIQFLEIKKFKMSVAFQNKKFNKMNLQDLPFVTPHSPLQMNPGNIKNRDGWSEDDFQRKVQYRTNSLDAALRLVESGLAAVYIPEFLRTRTQLLKAELSSKADNRTCYIVMSDRQQESPVIKKLAKLLRKTV